MKKKWVFGAVAVILTLAAACTNDNHGVPDEIVFGREGGKISIKCPDNIYSGDLFFKAMPMAEPELSDSPDSIKLRYEWLEVKARKGDKKFIMTADAMSARSGEIIVVVRTDLAKWSHIKITRKK